MDAVVERLREVGFTLYEARLYAALLQHGPQNGNELSRRSGVPSSKVYGTVEKMTSEGTVQTIRTPAGTHFVALDPAELVDRLRRRYNEPLDFLSVKLPPLATSVPDQAFLSVLGASSVVEAARQLIDAAEAELSLSLWDPELNELRGSLESAEKRKVRIFGMLYSQSAVLPPGTWHRHSYEEIVGSRVEGRLLSLVADDAEALVARLPDRGEAVGVRTRNPVLTLVVSEYLRHDLVLQHAQFVLGFDQWDKWWQADSELRGKILGRAMNHQSGGGARRPKRTEKK